MKKKILVIDDEHDICLILERFFKKKGFDCTAVTDEKYGFNLIKKNNYDLVITDLRLPTINGIDLLKKINELSPQTQVIIVTGYSDVKTAVKAIRYGAFDYVSKPLYPDELLATVNKAIETEKPHEDKQDTGECKEKLAQTQATKEYVIGSSKSAKKLFDNINLVAPTDMSVVILGETGTGKEYVAKEIHKRSDRKDERFFAVDCGALPVDIAASEFFGHEKGAFTGALSNKEGVFKAANKGTLFLDEVGNLSYDIQVQLLRVLQEKKYRKVGSNEDIETDVRIIAATNEDLKEAVSNGSFREDLYYRLNEFTLKVSPLRDRAEDIDLFAKHFMQEANKELNKNVDSIENCAASIFQNYYWPGNLREMKNVIKRAVLVSSNKKLIKEYLPEELLYSKDLQEENTNSSDLKAAADIAEKNAILKVLAENANNKTKAAKILNIDRKTLYNKLKKYEI